MQTGVGCSLTGLWSHLPSNSYGLKSILEANATIDRFDGGPLRQTVDSFNHGDMQQSATFSEAEHDTLLASVVDQRRNFHPDELPFYEG